MMEEEAEAQSVALHSTGDIKSGEDEAIDLGPTLSPAQKGNDSTADLEPSPDKQMVIRTLDGEIAGDELESDAINYQILLGKIEGLLNRLKLDA